ncbi:HAMP domain-containing sensor histidine kinase [Methylobacterium gnaphalii]|uniref:HAMP domain-containing sensor histidine kinase n=1 Tax=Methylobacterium gnaphalii TaxID=1010610 RepID=UPI0011BFB4EB|nr:ATP-binding protein [Methylobacterium gnaphalii]
MVSVAAIGWLVEVAVSDALRGQARSWAEGEIGALVDEFVHGGRADLDAALAGRLQRGEARLHYAIIETDGRVTGDTNLVALKARADTRAREFEDINADRSNRTVVAVAQTLSDGTRLIVTDDLSGVLAVQAIIRRVFGMALLASVVLGVALGALLSGAFLRRVDAINRTAEAIIAGDLGRRIDVAGTKDDFDRLAWTLNRMLDRISGLIENVRQVSNDIAHDLRTPLTRLQHGLQQAASRPSTEADFRNAIDRANVEIGEILDVFSGLLRIAQIEAGARRAGFRSVDLSSALRTVAEAYAPAIEDSDRSFVYDIEGGILVKGDKELLMQLFSNLCENALQHTPAGATIEVRLSAAAGQAEISFTDNGPGIPPEEREKVFRRFYRVEKSRSAVGNGLGLTLVGAVAELHGALIVLSDNGPGLRVTIVLAALSDGPNPER